MSKQTGRTCPLHYRYGAEAIARLPTVEAETLYVIGGLYGNLPALDAIEAIAAQEAGPVTLVFNGDFNWFNVDDAGFAEINRRVLAHHAIVGNVEAELGVDGNAAGCGCAYPEHVDSGVVERSNRIHARLKATAARHPEILAALAELPMIARYRVADCRVGIVHGDADSLAGWRFDPGTLDRENASGWLQNAFEHAMVDVFASTHTCTPVLKRIGDCLLSNNGAAGMPNQGGRQSGLLTRISRHPPSQALLGGEVVRGAHVILIHYNHAAWKDCFLANWPAGSDAWLSYFERIASWSGEPQ
ncbi:conserved hypothetical protein [Candidatus Accumulibacter aalborgensis]|uniref:Calcineurin-like phosphoesterase domain-containing protein n=1 Tax=Candidatus Accumulibacter aalborgensis TaxID=1860102 RepID=A0A1A8XWR5_9PROT|nr:hypothetical protein [Candidatus Accumulibacter aalborgensis]SBT09434.1 conserved hypothetical protein [Candidatus Accumulibacter aalborgensis]